MWLVSFFSRKRVIALVITLTLLRFFYYFYHNLPQGIDSSLANKVVYIYYQTDSFLKYTFSSVPSLTEVDKLGLYSEGQKIPWNGSRVCPIVSDYPLVMAMRTPKAASTTLEDLSIALSVHNKFIVNKVDHISPSDTGLIPITELDHHTRSVAEYFTALSKRTISLAHLRYINFRSFRLPPPVYISTIRDPIARMQSHYNYENFAVSRPWHRKHTDRGMDTNTPHPTFEQCVRTYMAQVKSTLNLSVSSGSSNMPLGYTCMNKVYLNTQLRYFCGISAECKQHHLPTMIEIAQENLQRDFLVVIVVERMGEGVQLLQTLLPSYFRGALQRFNHSGVVLHSNTNQQASSLSNHHSTDTETRPDRVHGVSRDVYDFLSSGPLKYEMQLYNTAVKHLEDKMKMCGLL